MATDTAEQAVSSCVNSGSAVGVPQLCFDWFPNQIFWLVVTLVVIYLILSRVALPRIASVLAERQGTITNDIAAAEERLATAQAQLTLSVSYQQMIDALRCAPAQILSDAIESLQQAVEERNRGQELV